MFGVIMSFAYINDREYCFFATKQKLPGEIFLQAVFDFVLSLFFHDEIGHGHTQPLHLLGTLHRIPPGLKKRPGRY